MAHKPLLRGLGNQEDSEAMKEPKIPHQWVWTGLHKAYGERPYREMVCTVCGATGKKFGLLESASVRTDYKYHSWATKCAGHKVEPYIARHQLEYKSKKRTQDGNTERPTERTH